MKFHLKLVQHFSPFACFVVQVDLHELGIKVSKVPKFRFFFFLYPGTAAEVTRRQRGTSKVN